MFFGDPLTIPNQLVWLDYQLWAIELEVQDDQTPSGDAVLMGKGQVL